LTIILLKHLFKTFYLFCKRQIYYIVNIITFKKFKEQILILTVVIMCCVTILALMGLITAAVMVATASIFNDVSKEDINDFYGRLLGIIPLATLVGGILIFFLIQIKRYIVSEWRRAWYETSARAVAEKYLS